MRQEIEAQLAGGFEKQLFNAALLNLTDAQNPLRFNNFAYAVRELIRHVLARLAPDVEVIACPWYSNETSAPDGVSRRQRAQYAIQGGLSQPYVETVLGIDLKPVFDALSDAVASLNKHTHIEPNTINIASSLVATEVDGVLAALERLLSAITVTRKHLITALWQHIDASSVDAALRETICEIDELATHHTIDEVLTEEVEIVGIDSGYVRFAAHGTVSCELQYGSNSDRRHGDAVVMEEGFPFACKLQSPVDDPEAVDAEDGAFVVDTSSWWNGSLED